MYEANMMMMIYHKSYVKTRIVLDCLCLSRNILGLGHKGFVHTPVLCGSKRDSVNVAYVSIYYVYTHVHSIGGLNRYPNVITDCAVLAASLQLGHMSVQVA